MAQIPSFNDKERLMDTLSSQKLVTDMYNSYANECANPEVKAVFMNILNEEHVIQHDVFCEMQSRGWYNTPQAEQQKVKSAVDKYRKDV